MNENQTIKCANCGAENAANMKFCVNCGSSLTQSPMDNNVFTLPTDNTPNIENVPQMEPVQTVANNNTEILSQSVEFNQVNVQQPTYQPSNPVPVNIDHNSTGSFHLFGHLLSSIIKPFQTYKKNEDYLNAPKNTFAILGLVVGVAAIFSLIALMLMMARTNFFSYVIWDWNSLKSFPYVKAIIGLPICFAGSFFAVAGVYYLGSLVIKKNTKYLKILAVTVTAYVPMIIALTIIYPITSLISIDIIGVIVVGVASIYSTLVFLELMRNVLGLENPNTVICLNLVCLVVSIIATAILFGVLGGIILSDIFSSSYLGILKGIL